MLVNIGGAGAVLTGNAVGVVEGGCAAALECIAVHACVLLVGKAVGQQQSAFVDGQIAGCVDDTGLAHEGAVGSNLGTVKGHVGTIDQVVVAGSGIVHGAICLVGGAAKTDIGEAAAVDSHITGAVFGANGNISGGGCVGIDSDKGDVHIVQDQVALKGSQRTAGAVAFQVQGTVTGDGYGVVGLQHERTGALAIRDLLNGVFAFQDNGQRCQIVVAAQAVPQTGLVDDGGTLQSQHGSAAYGVLKLNVPVTGSDLGFIGQRYHVGVGGIGSIIGLGYKVSDVAGVAQGLLIRGAEVVRICVGVLVAGRLTGGDIVQGSGLEALFLGPGLAADGAGVLPGVGAGDDRVGFVLSIDLALQSLSAGGVGLGSAFDRSGLSAQLLVTDNAVGSNVLLGGAVACGGFHNRLASQAGVGRFYPTNLHGCAGYCSIVVVICIRAAGNFLTVRSGGVVRNSGDVVEHNSPGVGGYIAAVKGDGCICAHLNKGRGLAGAVLSVEADNRILEQNITGVGRILYISALAEDKGVGSVVLAAVDGEVGILNGQIGLVLVTVSVVLHQQSVCLVRACGGILIQLDAEIDILDGQCVVTAVDTGAAPAVNSQFVVSLVFTLDGQSACVVGSDAEGAAVGSDLVVLSICSGGVAVQGVGTLQQDLKVSGTLNLDDVLLGRVDIFAGEGCVLQGQSGLAAGGPLSLQVPIGCSGGLGVKIAVCSGLCVGGIHAGSHGGLPDDGCLVVAGCNCQCCSADFLAVITVFTGNMGLTDNILVTGSGC